MFQSYMGWGGEAYASTTLFGELYLNFGIIGVVGGSFLFGLLARFVYAYLIGRVRTKSAVKLYSIILVQAGCFSEGPVEGHPTLSSNSVQRLLMRFVLALAPRVLLL